MRWCCFLFISCGEPLVVVDLALFPNNGVTPRSSDDDDEVDNVADVRYDHRMIADALFPLSGVVACSFSILSSSSSGIESIRGIVTDVFALPAVLTRIC